MIRDGKIITTKDVEEKVVACLSKFGGLITIERFVNSDDGVIEIDFEPINSNACDGSILIGDVIDRPPWVTLSAGTGLKFEWYEGCNYPDIRHFISAIASGNVYEKIILWREQWIASSGYIEIDGDRYDSSYVTLNLRYLLAKVTRKANESEVHYEPWEK